jgi:uracil phosphoribosyltransferase
MINILGNTNSVFKQYIAELRDINVQQDSMRFRRNLERIGEIFAYEISKTFNYAEAEVTTPLGISSTNLPVDQPVIGSILRAGLPLHNGILNVFDKAQNAFVSAYRKHHKDGTFDIQVEYVSSPDLTDRILILADPMLATGASMVLTYKALLAQGLPKHTHFVAALASVEGLDYAKRNLPQSITIWVGEVDDELTAQSYIVPGLGDAGDLAFGTKS